MSIVPAQTDISVVDSATTLQSLLDNLVGLDVDPPSLYLDFKGVPLGPQGHISVISLYVPSRKKIFLVNVHRLGKSAFSTTNSNATSLKTVLESPTIPKIIFDIRNNSHALFSHYEISVDGIKDLQLMELVTRKGSKDFVAGLAKCIEKDSPVSTAAKAEWQRMTETARRLYDPRKGGRDEIFNEFPMRSEIIQYCVRDVALLPGLYNVYNAKLRLPGQTIWQIKVQEATKDRIKLSQSPDHDGQPMTKVCGPLDQESIEQAIDKRNEDIMLNTLNDEDGNSEDYENDDWYESDDMSARDCIGWEEDMVKNGECF